MALQELYSDYKPQGLVGGIVNGLNTGANLGNMFANTASINQQTTAREQKLPWELAETAAKVDKDVMENDLTRATQSSKIDSINATNTTTKLTQKDAQKLLPIETFNKFLIQQTQQSAGMLTQAAERLEAGDKSVWQELSAMATSPEAKKVFQDTYNKFSKLPPTVAAQEARKWADKLMSDQANLDPATRLKMWEVAANNAARIQQDRIQAGSRKDGVDKMSIDQRISDAEAKKAQLLASGVKPNDPQIINLTNLVNSLNAARSKTDIIDLSGGLPSSRQTYGASGAWGETPAQPNKLKLPPGATIK